MRLALSLLLLAGLAGAVETRLGGLIRCYLGEKRPAAREEFLDRIKRLTGNDPRKVVAAIRRGEHFRHLEKPALRRGGAPPVFRPDRPRIQPIAESAGDFATLRLPEGYDPKRPHPLFLDLGRVVIAVPKGSIVVEIDLSKHPQTRTEAMGVEALVLSLLAHLYEVVNVDPDRVFLRAEVHTAPIAWYIALHNPDRFAGVLASQGFWKRADRLAENGKHFSVLAIERRGGDRTLHSFMDKLRTFHRGHLDLVAPEKTPVESLLPPIHKWQKETVRRVTATEIEVVCNRRTHTRAFWIRVAPKIRSLREQRVGRAWVHRTTNRSSRLEARLVPNQKNLVVVELDRVIAFDILVDPTMFDPREPLRVAIGGRAPVARVIDVNIADLLEDYRERRDPGLLYCCTLSFP